MRRIESKKMETLRQYTGYPAQLSEPMLSDSCEEYMNILVEKPKKPEEILLACLLKQRFELACPIQKTYVNEHILLNYLFNELFVR